MNYGKKNAAKIKWQLTSRGTVMQAEGKITDVADHIVMFCACAWLWRLPRISVCGTDNCGSTGYQ